MPEEDQVTEPEEDAEEEEIPKNDQSEPEEQPMDEPEDVEVPEAVEEILPRAAEEDRANAASADAPSTESSGHWQGSRVWKPGVGIVESYDYYIKMVKGFWVSRKSTERLFILKKPEMIRQRECC